MQPSYPDWGCPRCKGVYLNKILLLLLGWQTEFPSRAWQSPASNSRPFGNCLHHNRAARTNRPRRLLWILHPQVIGREIIAHLFRYLGCLHFRMEFIYIWPRGKKKISCLIQLNRKNSILGWSEPEKAEFHHIFYAYKHLKFHAQLSWAWKILITSEPDFT